MRSTTKAHLAVLGTNLFFAANFSLVKMVSPSLVKPFGLNIFRVGISLLLFWAIWAFGKTKAGIAKKDVGRFALCGLTGVAINQMLFIKGLTMTSTIHASLLMLTTPLIITVAALWVLRESLTATKIVGLLLGGAGAAVLILSKENAVHAPNYLFGDLLILINAVSYSVYFILVKPLMARYSPLHVVRWVFTFGLLLILPFGIADAAEVQFQNFSLQQALAFGAIIFTGTFLAYIFNAYGIQHLGAGTTGSYIYTQPVFAVGFATLLFGENLSPVKLLAAALIFSGVYLAGRKKG
jgi:drug/metabolite transporter (DMT)-like permease